MSQPFIGEIRMFAGNFPPVGWMFCEGQLLPISEFQALFALIGITYGGDGQSTFALPDLRGRFPLHQGNGFTLAENGGVETVTLTVSQIPDHSHPAQCSPGGGNSATPVGNYWATDPFGNTAAYNESDGSMMAVATGNTPGAIGPAGGSQPHSNFSPYLCVDFIISLFGVFPSQT